MAETHLNEIDFTAACSLILSGWPQRCGAVKEHQSYANCLLTLLNQEFRIDWRDDAYGSDVPYLAWTLLRSYSTLRGPFAGLMEYSFQLGEQAVWRRYKEEISAEEAQLKRAWVAFFRDLLLLAWPHAAALKTRWSRLRELGLVVPVEDEPDLF